VKLVYKTSFARDLRQIHDKALLNRLVEVMQEIEAASGIQGIAGLKKIARESAYYRLRLGDYRLGLKIEADTATLVRILHRKDIYRYFP
jgi:mRNA interferase RelE/StbE